MTHIKHKVFAYITNHQRLLLLRHVYVPEVGIQVPAGTLDAGESPEEGSCERHLRKQEYRPYH